MSTRTPLNLPLFLLAAVAIGAVAHGCVMAVTDGDGETVEGQEHALSRGWNEDDVRSIVAELEGVDPATYRLTVPTFNRGVEVGQVTYGRLSMADVEATAARLDVRLVPGSNVIQASPINGLGDPAGGVEEGPSGGGNDAGGGNGPGSHVNSKSSGDDLTERLGQILNSLDDTQYQQLH